MNMKVVKISLLLLCLSMSLVISAASMSGLLYWAADKAEQCTKTTEGRITASMGAGALVLLIPAGVGGLFIGATLGAVLCMRYPVAVNKYLHSGARWLTQRANDMKSLEERFNNKILRKKIYESN